MSARPLFSLQGQAQLNMERAKLNFSGMATGQSVLGLRPSRAEKGRPVQTSGIYGICKQVTICYSLRCTNDV